MRDGVMCGRLRADVERLHDVSTTQVDARESWGFAGAQGMDDFSCQDADLGRKASAIEMLAESAPHCSKQ